MYQHIRCHISIFVQPKSLNPWYPEFKNSVARRCTSTVMRVFNSFHICLIKPKASFHSSGLVPSFGRRSPLCHFYQRDTKSASFSQTRDCKWGRKNWRWERTSKFLKMYLNRTDDVWGCADPLFPATKSSPSRCRRHPAELPPPPSNEP